MRRRSVAIAAAVAIVAIAIAVYLVARHPVRRARVFHAITQPKPAAQPTAQLLPIDQWTDQFRALEVEGKWGELAELLGRIAKTHPAEFARWQLQYLQMRALLESDRPADALHLVTPFLAPNNPYREFALFHLAEIDETLGQNSGASAAREALIFGYPSSLYRDQAIDDEAGYLTAQQDVKLIDSFTNRIRPSVSAEQVRDLEAYVVEALMRTGALDAALQRGLPVLRAGTMDDAADRIARFFDTAAITRRLHPEELGLLSDAMFNHRHFDRAVALLSAALRGQPQKRDALVFAIGRSYFGDEKYAQALQTYMSGANGTRDPKAKAEFLLHASRCAQLQNDDATAEHLLTAAIAVPGRFPSTSAALTQRLRTRIKQRRFAEAAADLNAVRAGWPRDHAVVEASLAYAIGMLGAGNNGAALATFNAIPRNLLDKFEPYEIEYWRARALESSNPPAAFAAYLNVLRATMPTHFAYFARQRLDSQPLAGKLAQEVAARDQQVASLVRNAQWETARRVETDRVLLQPAKLDRLASIYRQIPAYDAILTLRPDSFPKFPLPDNADRMARLMAMGLFDEAADDVEKRWGLRPQRAALTRSLALNRGNASKDSIYAVEVMMNSVPNDYVPELLPETVRELLYPRYFYDAIADDSKRFGADPTLVLSIMREESRFNPRAKSQAAARGLLQFIITTARDIGQQIGLVDVNPEDLYDPRLIIRLGAKYVSTLSTELGDDHYKTAAAYNAGPKQVALWSRLAPGSGDDWFLSSINFDQTKQYVRKVMNSYKRYREIYANAGPQGGVRMEP